MTVALPVRAVWLLWRDNFHACKQGGEKIDARTSDLLMVHVLSIAMAIQTRYRTQQNNAKTDGRIPSKANKKIPDKNELPTWMSDPTCGDA